MNPELERTPKEFLETQIALLLMDSVYFYNNATSTISTYTVMKEGFSYSVIRYEEVEFIKHFNFIYLAKYNNSQKGFKSKQLSQLQFNEFVNQIHVLQEQAHLIKPLVSFENYIEILLKNNDLKLK